jgi:TPP-dependent pyruvate/acetoin dehydrogenase alpha subunit
MASRNILNLELYRKMYLSRQAEKRIRELYSEDEMKTPMHMSMGEEAIVAGLVHALKPDDQVFGTYRSHALYLVKTEDTDDFFAEMYGKDTALLKGKGGSMHMSCPNSGFMGTSAIVASIIPVATGAAFANKRLNNDKIVAVFFGDGAVDEGDFWESFNIACLMELPIIFVCEDNGFAVHTAAIARHGYKSLTKIINKFNCSVLKSDSTDAEVIYGLARKAIGLINKTGKPCFMHLKYYRYLEHVGVNDDFDAGYRPKTEYEVWHKRDPVSLQRSKILDKQIVTEPELCLIEDAINDKIEASIHAAQAAPFSDRNELFVGVFV